MTSQDRLLLALEGGRAPAWRAARVAVGDVCMSCLSFVFVVWLLALCRNTLRPDLFMKYDVASGAARRVKGDTII